MSEFMASCGVWTVRFVGSKLTFARGGSCSILDLTLANEMAMKNIIGWEVH